VGWNPRGGSPEAWHSSRTICSSEEVPYWGWSEGVVSISLPWWPASIGRSHWVRQGYVIAADRWEPDEPRGSRPVLRGRGVEISPRYSTITASFLPNSASAVAVLKERGTTNWEPGVGHYKADAGKRPPRCHTHEVV
jgi:hypothetical protein